MRFDRLKGRAVGPFRDEFDLDLTGIEGQLIAVCGPNGAGKSTLLELFSGSMYRRTPTRGSLVDLATARDAYVEGHVVNGKPWVLRQTMDNVSGKSEALVVGADGSPALSSTKVKEFDAWAAKTLPAEDVLYASTFAAQASGGFLEMKASERKALLLRILGIERLERLAGDARAKARDAKVAVDVVEARVRELRATGVDVAAATSEVAYALEDQIAALKSVEAEKARVVVVERDAETARAAVAAETERQRKIGECRARWQSADVRAQELDRRILDQRAILARVDEVRAAQVTTAELDARAQALGREVAELAAQEKAAMAELAAASSTRLREARTWRDAGAHRVRELEARVAEGQRVIDATASVPTRRAELAEAEQKVTDLDKQIEELHASTHGVAERRILNLRCGLDWYVDHPFADGDHAVDTLSDDNATARAAEGAPAKLRKAQEDVRPLRQRVTSLRLALNEAERVAATAPAVEQAKVDLEAARVELKEREAGLAKAEEASRAASAAATQARSATEAARDRLVDVNEERAGYTAALALAPLLATAEARISELQPQLEAASREALDTHNELSALEAAVPATLPSMPDVAGARAALNKAERAAAYADSELKSAEKVLAEVKARAARLAELDAEQATAAQDLADWTRLADDLGRDGLQAAIIDNAAPELTALTNDLLHGAFGTRFTARFDTQRASSDGKKELEVFDVAIIDTERGRDALAETLSGGERVIVGDAVRLALTAMACRQNGITAPTLVRDESGAALDPANARAYVAMLRRAATMIGARHVLFVSHSPEVQELADARVNVHDGKIEVAA